MRFIINLLLLLAGNFGISETKQGYLLTVPKILRAGSTEKVCVVLTDVFGDGNLAVSLSIGNSTITEEVVEFPRNGSCFFLKVPKTESTNGLLAVKGSFREDDYQFESETEVLLTLVKPTTFVQTDKAVYKAGQKVLFRVLSLDDSLKPILGTIPKVYVVNPGGVTVGQWLTVGTQLGLAQLEFQLTEEPSLGVWKIEVLLDDDRKVTQTFEVLEYVLPKFEVTIKQPKYLLATDLELKLKICAKYSYGKGVVGKLNVTIWYDIRYWYWDSKENFPTKEVSTDIDGCCDVIIEVEEMKWNKRISYGKTVKVLADVEELGTGVKRSISHDVKILYVPFLINFRSGYFNYLKPGLEYYDYVEVKNPDNTPVKNENVTICARRYYVNLTVCKIYQTDEYGVATFRIGPMSLVQTFLQVTAEIKKSKVNFEDDKNFPLIQAPYSSVQFKSWFSPSGRFLSIRPIKHRVACNEIINIPVDYTTDGEDLVVWYQIFSRGRTVVDGKQNVTFSPKDLSPESDSSVIHYNSLVDLTDRLNASLPDKVGSFDIKVEITDEMWPVSRILVFYVRPNGEVVSAHSHLKVETCMKNKVSFKFDSTSIGPGQMAKYRINAEPESVCAVTGVDKSVEILKSGNQISQDKIFKIMESFDKKLQYQIKQSPTDDYCRNKLEVKVANGGTTLPYGYQRAWYSSDYEDSITAFDKVGHIATTNLNINTRPCKKNSGYSGYGYAANGYGTRPQSVPTSTTFRPIATSVAPNLPPPIVANNEVNDEVVDVRNHFPETWLWDLQFVGQNGTLKVDSEIPHTITEWVASAYCISRVGGLGIAPEATIKAYKPFFLSYTLPYEVVRGEKVNVIVTVFNYENDCLPVKITLEKNENFEILGERKVRYCVCGNTPTTHRFKISPSSIGKTNLTVHGVSVRDENGNVCSKEITTSSVVVRDAITKPLRVEPEGFPQEITESILFCPSKSGYNHSFMLELPEDFVEGSARSHFSVTGDIMGPSLVGLDKLVRLPVGCGEQNMVIFVPIIFVMQYLETTKSLNSEIRSKSLGYLKTGYQRELTYRHDDGSYSAFGKSDKEGSLWLTAFVVRSFSEAKEFIDVDANDLQYSINWLLKKQLSDGCFPFIGMVHHQEMKGGVKRGFPSALTAYVLATLLETRIPVGNNTINAAFECIGRDVDPNAYTLALSAYAASLNNKTNMADDLLELLYKKAAHDNYQTYWESTSKSVSVEIGSYVILTLLKLGGVENQLKALKIVKWIAQQRNSNGGFVSTQDTVMALQSFAEFAQVQSSDPQDLTLRAIANSFQKDYNITANNRILMQKHQVEGLPNELQLKATGNGCGLAQATIKYNRMKLKASEAFFLEVEPSIVPWDCKSRTIKVCTSYRLPNEKSNMAIVSLKMASGFVPKKEALTDLKNSNPNLKRYEFDANYLNLYFDFLNNTNTCLKIRVDREVVVEDAKPASVSVYDYYLPELKLDKFYSIPEHLCAQLEPTGSPQVTDAPDGSDETS